MNAEIKADSGDGDVECSSAEQVTVTVDSGGSDGSNVSLSNMEVESSNGAVDVAPPPARREDGSLLAKIFPKSYLQAFIVTTIFGAALVASTVPQGLSYGRFATRSLHCYDEQDYYKLPAGGCDCATCDPQSATGARCRAQAAPSGCASQRWDPADDPGDPDGAAPCAWTDGTLDDPFCAVFSYPYRLVATTAATRFLPWAGYLVHQLGQWWLLRRAQLARDRGEIRWTLSADLEGKSAEEKRLGYLPNKYAKWMFGLNVGMTILKFFQAQIFYDGLASDVPEISALYSVAMWIVIALMIEMPRRGLVFGYWKSFDLKLCLKHGIGTNFIPFVRKYHGYAISFGTTYNFWYHPMEGSPGFVLGYLYQFCMILQSSFLFHPLHRNRFWTLLLELGVVPHSALIAIFLANGDGAAGAVTFGYGFASLFVITHMHGLGLGRGARGLLAAAYLGSLLGLLPLLGLPLSSMARVARIASVVALVPLAWAAWCVLQVLSKPFGGLIEKYPYSQGAFWFLVWAAQVACFIYVGATEGRSPEALDAT